MNVVSSFSFSDDKKAVLEEFTKIADREGKGRSELLIELVEEYVKTHSEGNPVFTLDQFQDPNFKAMPATMSPTPKWNEYIRKHMDRKEREKLDKQLDFMRMTIKSQNHMEDMNPNA